jgi:hypothetical protein
LNTFKFENFLFSTILNLNIFEFDFLKFEISNFKQFRIRIFSILNNFKFEHEPEVKREESEQATKRKRSQAVEMFHGPAHKE